MVRLQLVHGGLFICASAISIFELGLNLRIEKVLNLVGKRTMIGENVEEYLKWRWQIEIQAFVVGLRMNNKIL